MSIILPPPWRLDNKRTKNKRLTVILQGQRRFAMATAENGQLLSSVSPFACDADIMETLPLRYARECIDKYLDQVQPERILLLWLKPRKEASPGRMFQAGQLYVLLHEAFERLHRRPKEVLLHEIKVEVFGKEFVSNAKIIAQIKQQFPAVRDDEALAIFAALAKTTPPLYGKKLAF